MGSFMHGTVARVKSGLAGLNEKGQATSEYVLLILGVVLFLIVAAFALQGALNNAIAAITNWIAGVTAPPI